MKTFVIGDVHGCFKELKGLIDGMGIKLGTDRLVLLGDYIDRGEGEHEVLDYIKKLRGRYGMDKVIALRGNHEQMLLDATENGFHTGSRFSSEEIAFMNSLPVYFEDDYCFYVHGGIDPAVSLDQQKDDVMLWIREEFYLHPESLQKKVVFGHTPTRTITGKDIPIIWEDRVALDTGCVFGGRLSALEISEDTILAIHMVIRNHTDDVLEVA